ncbi:MAG: rhomboid family intramembrane serine protease [Bacteroidales bacterium]|nr:rhomboid family intramembrane serine protease [Bacteroidales bacterium]
MSDTYSPGRFSFLPNVTKNLLIINTLCYFAMVVVKQAFGFDMNDLFGLHYYQSSHFHPFQFITYMFMHGSFEHLFFNMFALWMFGSVIENYWGGRKYLLYYLMTGIGAAMTHYLVLNHQLQAIIPTIDEDKLDYFLSLPNIVGASGSIYGLLLAFGMLFPNDRIYLYFLFPIKAKWFVLIFGLLELFSGITGTADGVAHFAHLGGMVFGIILILLWRRRERMQAYDYEPRQRRRWRRQDDFDESYERPRSDDDFNAEKAENRRRIDEILDKISRNGYDALTKEEKEFLFKSSNKEKRW